MPAPVSRAAGAAVNAADSALQGAGARMLPALAQLYSRAAGTLIGAGCGPAAGAGCAGRLGIATQGRLLTATVQSPAPVAAHTLPCASPSSSSPLHLRPPAHAADDPVMLGLLREAQQQADVARHRLVEAEGRAVALLRENIALKQQLGLPTEEEIAALTAWTCSGSGLGTPAAAQQVQQQAALPAAEEGEGEEAGAPAAAGAPPADGPADEGEEEAGEEEVMAAADPPSSAGGSASRRRRGSQRA